MLDKSNTINPSRKVEFQNFTFKVIRSLKSDPSEIRFGVQHGVADLDQSLDLPFLFDLAVENNPAWNIEKVELVHSFVDSTEQL